MSLILEQFEIGPMQNFCYVIADSVSRKAMVLDPAWDALKIMSVVDSHEWELTGLIVSHAHYDHTNAILDILAKKDVPVFAQKEEINYAKEGISIVGELGKSAKPVSNEHSIKVGEVEIAFLPTPGHTPGSQCVIVDSYLLTGDTLFIGGCGRSDLPGGNPALLYQSLQKLSRLSPALTICPGHDYGPQTKRLLAEELKDNPYLTLPSEEKFMEAVRY